jgi:adenylate cyclase
MSFWSELRRRNVVKVAIAYAIVGWLLVQVADTFFPALQLPEWTVTLVAALVILGLPIALILSWAFDVTPDGIVRTQSVASASQSVVTDAAIADTEAVSGRLVENAEAQQESPQKGPAAGTMPDGVLANSVAVLPLDNLSPDPDNAYFAAGLHEEILNQLAKLSGLNVISRTSVLGYAKDRPPIAEIAKALNVQSVMEGSIRYAGNRIRATVQLISSATGAHLWSETYERELDDIFAIESDIAINVAKALQATFSPEEQQAVENAPTRSTEAYDLYLRIMPIRYSHLAKALELTDQALEIDPDFALVHMTKGYLYANAIVANVGQTSLDAKERMTRFEELARYHSDRALEIDPTLKASKLGLALIDLYHWYWSRSRAAMDGVGIHEFDASLGSQFYVWLCCYQGDFERAREIARQSVALNPNDWRVRWALSCALQYSGDHAAARDAHRDAVSLNSSMPVLRWWLAYIHISLGENDEALAELRMAEQLMGKDRDIVSLPEITYSYARLGRQDDVARLTAELKAYADRHDVGAGAWSVMHLANGDLDRAAESIETVIEEAGRHVTDQGFWPVINMKMNVTTDPLLEEPRFVELRNRITGD